MRSIWPLEATRRLGNWLIVHYLTSLVNEADLQAIANVGVGCRVLGTERFQKEIEATLARRVRPGKPGRP